MPQLKNHGHTVQLSHLDKVFFPKPKVTKGDLVEYFERVAPLMLPYLRDRPMMLQRYPDGIEGQSFYQKQIPDYFPDWIETATVEKKGTGEQQTLVVCNNLETLIYLVNQGCFTFHPWLSRRDRPNQPDRAIIDLDPSDDGTEKVRKAALAVSEALRDNELDPLVTTTGSSGYHLVLPLRRGKTFDQVRENLSTLTQAMEKKHPNLLTTEQRKAKRGDKVYLDIARNAYAQTSVSIYSVRPIPGAPVVTPLDLFELKSVDMHPQRYTIKNLFRRLSQKDNPWEGRL